MSSKPPNRAESQYLYKTFTIKTGLKNCHQHQERPKESELFSTKILFLLTFLPQAVSACQQKLDQEKASMGFLKVQSYTIFFSLNYHDQAMITWRSSDIQYEGLVCLCVCDTNITACRIELSDTGAKQNIKIQPKFIRPEDPNPNGQSSQGPPARALLW